MSKAAEKAYKIIRSQILTGALASGSHLKEEELAESIGVSRTPVREALRRLNAEQFVSFSPNQGTRVAAWSEGDIAEIFALRSMLEGYAAELAATLVTDEELEELFALQAIIERAAAASPPDLARLTETNHTFHRTLLKAARSERLKIMVSWLIEMPVMLKTFRIYSPADLQRSLGHHRELLEALKSRDGQWARRVMQTHVSAARNVYFRAWRDGTNTGSPPPDHQAVAPVDAALAAERPRGRVKNA